MGCLSCVVTMTERFITDSGNDIDFFIIGINGWAGSKGKGLHERLGECKGNGLQGPATDVDNWRFYGRDGHGIENVTFSWMR